MALEKGFGNPSCGFGWRGLRGRGGLRSHPLTTDTAAPTPSFLRASHIAATALLPELGRALGRLPSQVKVLEDALAFTLHSSGVAGGGTAQQPKCQRRRSEPSFTSHIRKLVGISPAPTAMHACNRRMPVPRIACCSRSCYIIEHLLYILHMWFHSTHRGNYYLSFRNRGSSEQRIQDRGEARCQVRASDPSVYALEQYPTLPLCAEPRTR